MNDIFSYYSLGEIILAIQNDISTANHELDADHCREYLNHPFFKK